jgi:hypothetical protein
MFDYDAYLWEGGVKAMIDDYRSSYYPPEDLKANCYPCNKPAQVSHSKMWDKEGTWNTTITCPRCQKTEKREFTTQQIEESNKAGVWQAFMYRL